MQQQLPLVLHPQEQVVKQLLLQQQQGRSRGLQQQQQLLPTLPAGGLVRVG
jgi:hypothetical protein